MMAAVESVALQLRLGHQTEVSELREGFTTSQKGSSAMPHKQNAIEAERLCGLARLVRAMVAPTLENVTLWHERDISHSSVERVVLFDACAVTHFGLVSCTDLVRSWRVDAERMRENLSLLGDTILGHHIGFDLIGLGWQRGEAYRVVQSAGEAARRGVASFRATLEAAGVRWPSPLDDPMYPLRNASRPITALDDSWAQRARRAKP